MNYNIKDFFKEVENGNLDCQRKDGLILFDYTRTCAFERNWNPVTLAARGIVFEEVTGKLIARPLAKFFNLTEPGCEIKDLPQGESFIALDKLDGSCGIVFNYNDSWVSITRGSFSSSQSKWATEFLNTKVNTSAMDRAYTFVFEIIYKENKIVIDYHGKEMLSLLACIHTETGNEVDYSGLKVLADGIGVECVEKFPFTTLKEIYEAQSKLGADREGWVVWYPKSNFRFKLKGDEYCRIHKMISNLTALGFWRAIDYENTLEIPVLYMAGLPEEFRETSDLLKYHIEKLHKDFFNKIKSMAESCPKEFESKFARYTYMMETFGDLGSLVLAYVEGKLWRVKKFVHDEIRPKNNIIPGVDLTRIDRIINNDG